MKQVEQTFAIAGLGAWGLNFRSVAELRQLVRGLAIEDDGAKGPKPEIIPANERRRAPLPVRLAVETSWQACQDAAIDPEKLGAVFVSALGDTQLTDYMCRQLAGENKSLSPTKFHNSVHNAAAGYWTISTGCMQAANSIAGYEESVSLTLLESLTQANFENRPMLMTFYDAPVSPVLRPILHNGYAFAVSIVIVPVAQAQLEQPHFSYTVDSRIAAWPRADWHESLNDCYQTSPVAKILALLAMLLSDSSKNAQEPLSMPLSKHTCLTIRAMGG